MAGTRRDTKSCPCGARAQGRHHGLPLFRVQQNARRKVGRGCISRFWRLWRCRCGYAYKYSTSDGATFATLRVFWYLGWVSRPFYVLWHAPDVFAHTDAWMLRFDDMWLTKELLLFHSLIHWSSSILISLGMATRTHRYTSGPSYDVSRYTSYCVT